MIKAFYTVLGVTFTWRQDLIQRDSFTAGSLEEFGALGLGSIPQVKFHTGLPLLSWLAPVLPYLRIMEHILTPHLCIY